MGLCRQGIKLHNGLGTLYHFCAAAIRIGFEKEINRFTEPAMFEDDAFIYVAKENNVSSEQTFMISFQRRDSVPQDSGFAIAKDREDYRGIPQEFLQDFSPRDERIHLHFQLLADSVPEATEAFQISLSPQVSPTFDSANVLFTRTFVVIDNDDSESKLNYDVIANYYEINIVIVRIGFDETAYTVNEEAGVQEVCVRVFEPDERMSLDTEITAVTATRVGTASMC